MSRIQRQMFMGTTSFYSEVLFDPILTPLFTAILGTGYISIGAATFTYASIATAIASTAISFGLQYLLAPKPPKPEDGKVPRSQAIPHRIYGVGTNRIAGTYMTWEAVGPYLCAVIALCGHPISAVNTIYLHDDIVTRTGNYVNQLADQRYRNNAVWIDTRLGAVPETAYSYITTSINNPEVYSASFRGDGQASLGMVCVSQKAKIQGSVFPYGAPQPSVVADLAKVWDFRDPLQNPDDPTTWTFSKNPVLCWYWHHCFNPYYGIYDYRTALLPILEEMKAEANICDDPIPKFSGGTEARYECNGWATTETDPSAVSNAIASSCDGWSLFRGDGVLEFRVGLFRESLVQVLTDADIVGHSIDEDVAEEDEINRLVPKFNFPAADYTITDTDFFEDTAAQLVSGRILSQDIDLGWVQSWRQARRVALRNWKRIQQKRRGTFNMRLSGINSIYSRWVRLETPLRIPRMNGVLIENMMSIMSLAEGGLQMNWVQHPEDIDVWDPATDEGAAPPVPQRPSLTAIEFPTVDSISAIGSSGTVYIRAVVIEPSRPDLDIAIRYRTKAVPSGALGDWVETRIDDWTAVSGLVTVSSSVVPNGALLETQTAFIGPGNSYSTWSAIEEITAVVDSVAPGPVNTLVSTGGAGQVSFTWNAPSSANYHSAIVKRNTVNNETTSTVVSPTIYGFPSSANAWVNTGLAAGTYYFWVVSQNGSLVPGSSVASGAKTVT